MAEVALCQIEEKESAEAFSQDPRKLYKIGINFNSGRRLIDDWVVE